jgi:hypothetical protein
MDTAGDPECSPRIVQVHVRCNTHTLQGYASSHELLCHAADRGLELKPNRNWDGDLKFDFIITGRSDSDYATDTDTRKSISGSAVFFEGAPVVIRSSGQKSVTLSMTEAELATVVQMAQDMMFVMRVIESVGLKVQKPMILKMDNSGAHDLTHNWSVGGRTQHADMRMHFLRELKEEGIIVCDWVSGEENSADLFTKNLAG